jgi:hypothetical protein
MNISGGNKRYWVVYEQKKIDADAIFLLVSDNIFQDNS